MDKNNTWKPRVASETFGTAIMKTEEAFLFVKAAVEGGSDLETANRDMHMIDDLLHMERLHFSLLAQTNKTKSGHYRKNHFSWKMLDGIIDGYVQEEKALNKECNENNSKIT
jgi:hypothetical protein